jgi:osmotically-inducible protein OsmY
MTRISIASTLRPIALALAVASGAAVLQACAPILIGGAAMGVGGMAVTDRRSVGIQVEDQNIEIKAGNRISEKFGDAVHVNVNVYNRKMLLSGEVPNDNAKSEIERIVGSIENLRSVVNDLAVAPASSLTTRANDSVLTGKVKATLIDAKDLFSNAFRVNTDRGNVYLMGIVTEREGKRAAQLISTIPGILKVVTAFDYISEGELQGLSKSEAERQQARSTPAPVPQ